jgi:hypothetical protein
MSELRCPTCGYADGIAPHHANILYCMNCDWKGTLEELSTNSNQLKDDHQDWPMGGEG